MENFLNYVKRNLPEYFQNTAMLDLGNSLHKKDFKTCRLISCDWEGDVDYITKVNNLEFVNNSFDCIIALDYFNKDKTRQNIENTLKGISRLIKQNGMIIISTNDLRDITYFKDLAYPYYTVYKIGEEYVMICVLDGEEFKEILIDDYHGDEWKKVF